MNNIIVESNWSKFWNNIEEQNFIHTDNRRAKLIFEVELNIHQRGSRKAYSSVTYLVFIMKLLRNKRNLQQSRCDKFRQSIWNTNMSDLDNRAILQLGLTELKIQFLTAHIYLRISRKEQFHSLYIFIRLRHWNLLRVSILYIWSKKLLQFQICQPQIELFSVINVEDTLIICRKITVRQTRKLSQKTTRQKTQNDKRNGEKEVNKVKNMQGNKIYMTRFTRWQIIYFILLHKEKII